MHIPEIYARLATYCRRAFYGLVVIPDPTFSRLLEKPEVRRISSMQDSKLWTRYPTVGEHDINQLISMTGSRASHSYDLFDATVSSMHQALFIQELLLRICELLRINSNQSWTTRADQADRRAAKVALASLASTCRIFHNPAISTLWASQTSLTPLVLCLGDSVSLADPPVKWPSYADQVVRSIPHSIQPIFYTLSE